MFKRILVPLDGSALAEQAIPTAGRIARATGGSVVLVQVISPLFEYGYGPYLLQPTRYMDDLALRDDLSEATHYLERVATSIHLVGVETEVEAWHGSAAVMILSAARAKNIDLIVMCSHGYTGLKRWVLGSVAQKVARHAPVPVLVLHQHTTANGPRPTLSQPIRVLVPLDGSVLARAALTPAVQLAATLAAPGQGAIHLVRVVKRDILPGEVLDPTTKECLLHKAKIYLASVTEHLRESIAAELKVAVTWSVALETDAAKAIINVAENGEDAEGAGIFGGCECIALATHGRGGLQRWAMGSVAERVLAGTTLPVLIVRAQHAATGKTTDQEEVKQAGVQAR
jgi:nucleotide-binding universal stress UspA family protein